MADEVKKRVDESWKERVEIEKEKPKPSSGETGESEQQEEGYELPAEPDFRIFISNLGMQAMMSLGEIENPITKKREKNLPQAKYIIDTIELLKEKTRGNLTREEENLMENILYNLRMKFASVSR